MLLVAPFGAAAHLANAVRDFPLDAAAASRNLAQVLGVRLSRGLAVGLALLVGLGVAIAFAVGDRPSPVSAVVGGLGLAAVAFGSHGSIAGSGRHCSLRRSAGLSRGPWQPGGRGSGRSFGAR